MGDEQTKPLTAGSALPSSVKFAFEKSPFYRSIHADSAWGRVDGALNIHLTFFNEKPQLPSSGVLKVSPQGQWIYDDTKIQFATDAQLVREVEADVILNVPAAIALRETLNGFIKMALDQMETINQKGSEMQKMQSPESVLKRSGIIR
jgi:hypothetical protein